VRDLPRERNDAEGGPDKQQLPDLDAEVDLDADHNGMDINGTRRLEGFVCHGHPAATKYMPLPSLQQDRVPMKYAIRRVATVSVFGACLEAKKYTVKY